MYGVHAEYTYTQYAPSNRRSGVIAAFGSCSDADEFIARAVAHRKRYGPHTIALLHNEYQSPQYKIVDVEDCKMYQEWQEWYESKEDYNPDETGHAPFDIMIENFLNCSRAAAEEKKRRR